MYYLTVILMISLFYNYICFNKINQKQDLENRFGTGTLTESNISTLAYEVLAREVIEKQSIEDIMIYLKSEYGLSKQDIFDVNNRSLEILREYSSR